MSRTPSPKGRRVSIDLTAAAAAEVDRLRAITELGSADLFRHALHLLRMYVDQRSRGNSLYFANAENPQQNQVQIELPITVTAEKSKQQEKSAAKMRPT